MATRNADGSGVIRTKPWRTIQSNTSSLPLSSDTLIARTAVTPKTRIVVVRTTSSIQDENGEEVLPEEPARSKSVELPPMFTNGRTSVYLIRRPIPPLGTPKETLFYQTDDIEERKRRKTTKTTTTTTSHGYDSHPPTSVEDIGDSQDPYYQSDTSSRKPRSYNDHPDSPTVPISDNNRLKSPIDQRSSPTQSTTVQPRQRRSRSRSKSRTRVLPESHRRGRSRSTKQRVSPEQPSSTPPPPPPPPVPPSVPTSAPTPLLPTSSPPKQEEPIEPLQKRSLSSVSETRNIAVQANLLPKATQKRAVRVPGPRRLRRRKSTVSRAKTDEQTISVIEDLQNKDDTTRTMMNSRRNSSKRTRSSQEIDNQSTEELMKTSRWQKCFGCLLRHMCLIVIICLLLLLIGLAGIGVSAYFLATDSQNNLIPTVIGIAIGGVFVLIGLGFLCCVLGCIGSREGYFKYNGDARRTGGRAFALIPSVHPNADRYIPREYTELSEQKLTSASTIVNTQQTLTTTNNIHQQQRTLFLNGHPTTTNSKNVTIEMPERLLTGRKMSPKSHQQKLNKVVHHIGHVVADTQKRYHGEVPKKVIVKMDENVKANV